MDKRFLDKDILGGLMLLVIAVIGGAISLGYPAGSTVMMGPGYVPRVLCAGLALVSVLIIVGGLRSSDVDADDEERFAPQAKPLACAVGAVVLFGLIIGWAGLLLSVIALIAVATGAAPKYRAAETAILGVVLAVATALVFVVGLGLPIPLWPEPFR